MRKRKTLQELRLGVSIEKLKTCSELFDEDPRFAENILWGAEYDEPPIMDSYALEDHCRRFALISAPSAAPVEVVGSFITAQHLAIYSWFFFPFATVAESQAYGTLEMALRRRMNNDHPTGLRARLEFAHKKGWIHPERLLLLDPCITLEAQRSFKSRPIDPKGSDRIQFLIENLPIERNWLAHGNWSQGTDPFMTLDTISQLLDQLYPVVA
jgi:hypothetical protein